MPSYSAGQRSAERQRVIPGREAIDVVNLFEIRIEGVFAQHLLHDSRETEPD